MAIKYYTDREIAKIEQASVEIPPEFYAEIDRIKNAQDSAGTDHNLWDEFLSKFTFDANNFLRAALASDEVGIAKDSTLSSRLPREIELDDGSGTYDKLYRSGNALLISINEDKVGILKKGDLNFDANGYLNVNAQVVANPSNLDITLSNARDSICTRLEALDPLILDELILNNATIDAAGESSTYGIRGAKHVDVLIYVGAPTGSPNVTFHLQVIEPTSGKVIRTYDGNQLTAEGADWITVDGLTLGTHVKVTWDGTLDSSNYFSGCFVRIVAKR